MDSFLSVSIEQILKLFRTFMETFKVVMEWLGIAVLPDHADDEETTVNA